VKEKKFLVHLLLTLVAIATIGFGMSLIIKANLGQSTVSGFTNALAHVMNIKAGTVLIYFNLICFVFELILLGKKAKLILVLQPLLSFVFGYVVNFFLYDFTYLANLVFSNYAYQLMGLLSGIVLMSLGVSLMMSVKLVVLPYDAFIVVFSDHFKIPFVRVRTGADFIFVLSSLLMAWAFTLNYAPVREGTVIFALTVGSLIGFFSKYWKHYLKLI
jgi:uncharacterized membrane protein YczE